MHLSLILPFLMAVHAAAEACGRGPLLGAPYVKSYIPCIPNGKDGSVYFCGGTGTSVGAFFSLLSSIIPRTLRYYIILTQAVAKGPLITLRAGNGDSAVWVGCGKYNDLYIFHCKAGAQMTFDVPGCRNAIREIKGVAEYS